MANYQLSNFLATPTSQDTRMRIYDKNSKLRYTLDPNIAYFYKKANIVIIKVDDRTDIYLDFGTTTESAQALAKLNEAKRMMTQPGCAPQPGEGESVFSRANLNMPGIVTPVGGGLACSSPIIDRPISNSYVRVFINGQEINTGGKTFPHDAYFSVDGITERIVGDERQGDKLYWNYKDPLAPETGFNLDTIDLIDFIYLIEVNI